MLPVLLGALLGALAGAAMWSWLRTGRYRRDDDALRRDPGGSWVVIPAAAAAGALAGGCPGWLAPVAWVYLVGALPVVWVDLDVHRVPDQLLRYWAPVLGLAVIAAAAVEDDWGLLARAIVGGGVLGGLFLLLALLGSMGLGDVKLAAVTGLFTGALGWGYLITGAVAGFAAGAVAGGLLLARGRARTTHLAFGPAIVAGAAAAALRLALGA